MKEFGKISAFGLAAVVPRIFIKIYMMLFSSCYKLFLQRQW
jgi:hypothetical protein